MAFQNIAPFLTSVWGEWAFENPIHFTLRRHLAVNLLGMFLFALAAENKTLPI